MKYLIYLELKKTILLKKIKDFGLPPYITSLFLILAFFYFVYRITKVNYGVYINYTFYILLKIMFIEHKDIQIVKSYFKYPWKLFLIENILLSIPFIFISIYIVDYNSLIIYFLLILILSFIKIKLKIQVLKNIRLSYLMPSYELIYGFRTYIYIIPITLFFFYIGYVSSNFNLALFGVLLFYIILLQYYNIIENKILIWQHCKSSSDFITLKIKSLFYKLLPIGFFFLIYFLMSPKIEEGFFLILSMSIGMINQMLLKYAYYGRFSSIMIFQTIVFFGGVLGFLFPPVIILSIMLFYYLRQIAISNLDKLFYA